MRFLLYLTQSTLKSDRLNGLASIYINIDIYVNLSSVLKKTALTNPNRRANFGILNWFRRVWSIYFIYFAVIIITWYLFCRCYFFDINVVVYFAAKCSFFLLVSFRKGSKVLQAAVCFHFISSMWSFSRIVPGFSSKYFFLFVVLLFTSMEVRFFKQQCGIILSDFILSRIFNQ